MEKKQTALMKHLSWLDEQIAKCEIALPELAVEELTFSMQIIEAARLSFNAAKAHALSLLEEDKQGIIQTCKECGIFAFTTDGEMCMNGHLVSPLPSPPKETEL